MLKRTLSIISILIIGCHVQPYTKDSKKTVLKEKPSNFTKIIVAGIASGNRIESAHIGLTGEPSAQWAAYLQLKKAASVNELISLNDDKNAAVKCYSFQALASKKCDDVFPILLKHLHDTATVETQSGCITMSEYVGNYLLNVVTPGYIEPDAYKLDSKQKAFVDSILINDKTIKLFARDIILQNKKNNNGVIVKY